MVTLSGIKATISHPLEATKFWSWRLFGAVCENKGIYIVDEDWDNLIILDACRYDFFRKYNIVEGKPEFRISRGSCTLEFLRENFEKYPKRSKFNDIVYVTANPFVNKLLPNSFYKIYPTWDYGWDEKLNTVPPENVVKDALLAQQKHPNKRLIIHFMQPHRPFLGVELPKETGFGGLRESALKNVDAARARDVNLWYLVEKGKLDLELALRGHIKNLKIVLRSTKKLVAKLYGKTVITSDHGNLFGEIPNILYPFRTYGHPLRLYVELLIKVPWLVRDNKERKTITSGEDEHERIKIAIKKLKPSALKERAGIRL